jgi:putative ABC transport system permease protein
MNTLLQDIRYGIRMLLNAPGFTAIAVLTLALGIGANTAIFSVIDSVLLQPLPFKNPSQLVDLRETESSPGNFPLDGADYLDWQKLNKTFASMSVFSYRHGYNASGAGEPEAASVRETEANFFDTLGVSPLIGRTFAPGEDAAGKNHVVILSYGFWQRHFGGQPDALQRTVQLNDEAYTVVGVTPRWFNFPAGTDLWVPIDINSTMMHNRGSHWANAVGRMRTGVTIEQARADLLAVSAHLNKTYRTPDDQDIHSLVFPLKDRLVGQTGAQLLLLLGAVALVLLVACANVANLLLARASSRQRELAVRAALGAGRWRLARQLLTESILLAFGGAILGFFGAWWGVALLQAAETAPIPRVNPLSINATVLFFTIGVSVLVGILFGLAPALQCSHLDLSEELKSSANAVISATGRGRAVRNALIVFEIAVCLALLVGAGLLMRSFARLRSADIGIQPDNVLTMSINLPESKYATAASRQNFQEQLISRMSHIPGVAHAAISNEIAVDGGSNGYVKIPGVTNPKLQNQLVELNYITPDYFRAFGIPLLEGRNFTEQDVKLDGDVNEKVGALYKAAKDPSKVQVPPSMTEVVVINQAMASTFWPNQNPIGKTYNGDGGPTLIIIGVVGNERQWSIREPSIPENYFPMADIGNGGTLSLKTTVVPTSVVSQVRNAVRDLDPNLALFHVRTMDEIVAEDMTDATTQTFVLVAFAVLALVLACVGLYGVMSYLVTQRTHEIGVRMALGAQQRDVLRLVIGQGAKLILIGLAVGVASALGLTQLLTVSLYGVAPTDPATYVVVSVLLAVIALLACYIPARRATRVDPMVALRYE